MRRSVVCAGSVARGQRHVPRRSIGTDVLLNRPQGSGIVATVFGATGFVGRYVVNRLGRVGSQVVLPYRGEEHGYKHMKVMGDLGQIVPVRVNIRDTASIERAVAHSNVVINLIGRLRSTANFSLEEVHVEAASRIAQAAREAGVVRLVHVSDNLASEESSSRYARAKAAGEAAVKKAFPEATVVRPTDIFGAEDRFLNRFGIMVRKWPSAIGLLACGPNTRQVQPLWVSDFASALMNIVEDDRTAGKTFHLGGPRVYSMQQIFDLVNHETISESHVTRLPPPVLSRVLKVLQYSRKNLFSPEDDILHSTDNVVPADAVNTIASLNVNPSTLEKRAIETLRIYRRPFFVNMVDWEAESQRSGNDRFLPGDKP